MKKRIIVFLAVFCFCLSGCGSPTDLLRGIDLPFVDFDSEEDSYASSEEETEEKETAETAEAEEAAKAAERAAAEQAAADQAAEEARIKLLKEQADQITADISVLQFGPDIGPELSRIQSVYDALPADAKKYVDGYSNFCSIQDEYNAAMASVSAAEEAIDAIGEISENSMSAIEDAQASYDSVPAEFQASVSNADLLNGAEDACRQAIGDKGVSETQALIDAGQYQEAADYADQYLLDHQDELGSQTELTAIQQTAQLYLAWELYNTSYLEDAQDILDELTEDAVNDDIYYGAQDLQTTMDGWLASVEPYNGKILDSTISGGYGELTVLSGSGPMLIKVEDSYDSSRYISFYVRADSEAMINVPDGDYYVKYFTGDVWYGMGSLFGRNTSGYIADDIMSFETTYSGNYVEYSTITLTLYSVVGGNLTSSPLDVDDY